MRKDTMPKTFEDWRNDFFEACDGSSEFKKRVAFSGMVATAKTFGQWLNIYQEMLEPGNTEKFVLNKLMELADEPKDINWTKSEDSLKAIRLSRWQKIFDICLRIQSYEEMFALSKIERCLFAIKHANA